MRRVQLRSTALVTLILAMAPIVGVFGFHAHALGESDLVPHSLVAIEHSQAATDPAHLDRARELDHRACPECILASSCAGRQAPAAVLPVSQPASVAFEAPGRQAHSLLSTRSGPARAPPAA